MGLGTELCKDWSVLTLTVVSRKSMEFLLIFAVILTLPFITNSDNGNVQQNNNDINEGIIHQNNASNIADECATRYFKRYKIRNIPVNFLESDIAR